MVGAQDRILPLYDEELTKPVAASLRKLGVQVLVRGSLAACRIRTAGGWRS